MHQSHVDYISQMRLGGISESRPKIALTPLTVILRRLSILSHGTAIEGHVNMSQAMYQCGTKGVCF